MQALWRRNTLVQQIFYSFDQKYTQNVSLAPGFPFEKAFQTSFQDSKTETEGSAAQFRRLTENAGDRLR